MGLGKSERKTFLRISKGKIHQTVPQGTAGSIMVEVKDDDGNIVKTKYELQFSDVSGIVKNCSIKANEKTEYPDTLVIEMEDGIDYYYVQISVDSSLSNKIINKFCNPIIDWEKPIKIIPYYFEDQHTNAIVVEQEGAKIPPFFSKTHPGECPQVPQEYLDEKPRSTRTKNEIKKIMIDVTAYLQDYFADHVIPIIRKGSSPQKSSSKPEIIHEEEDLTAETGGDDLPF